MVAKTTQLKLLAHYHVSVPQVGCHIYKKNTACCVVKLAKGSHHTHYSTFMMNAVMRAAAHNIWHWCLMINAKLRVQSSQRGHKLTQLSTLGQSVMHYILLTVVNCRDRDAILEFSAKDYPAATVTDDLFRKAICVQLGHVYSKKPEALMPVNGKE